MTEIVEIQAYTYSEDKTSAKVFCPCCAQEHNLRSSSWKVNQEGPFKHELWYGHECPCGCSFCFRLEFEKKPLITGEQYLIKKPAHSFGVIDGNLTNFKEKTYAIEVLEKPSQVTVWDGEQETVEPTPEHLAVSA